MTAVPGTAGVAADLGDKARIRKHRPDRDRIRVALVGCGAVARANLLPVLAGHERITLTALADLDVGRAKALASSYRVPRVLAGMDDLSSEVADAAVLATPPAHHAPATIALAARGLHVFVEKPMATRSVDAEAMVAAADQAGVALGVGLYRRFVPSVRLLKHLLETREYGLPLAVDIEEGGPYGWQLATLKGLTREAGGGGVLIDIGSHLIDELMFALPGHLTLDSFHDNARGGIETDCLVHCRLASQHSELPVRMELSRTRELRNSIRVECEGATLELRRPDFARVLVHRNPNGARDVLDTPTFQLDAVWAGRAEFVGYQAFREEIDDWLAAISDGGTPCLSGRSVLPTVRFIEECYERRIGIPEPWTDEGLAPGNGGTMAGNVTVTPRQRRVLVTGAGGFLGCRTVEILRERHGWNVVPLVHRPSGAARLARWPGKIITGDVCSPNDMARAVAGCDAVVHCAVGTTWPPDAAHKVTVDGTRVAAEAALDAGVGRFVHISSLFVHRRDGSSVLDETTPLEPAASDAYGRAKLAAERVLQRLEKRGLSTVVLRPARIYGPFSKTFTVRPLQAIANGTFAISGNPEVPANMVYVDNVAAAIAAALQAPDSVSGSAYLIADVDQVSLREFYDFFAAAAGNAVETAAPSQRAPRVGGRRSAVIGWLLASRTILRSPQLRAFIRLLLDTDPIGRIPRRIWNLSPRLQESLLRAFGADAAVVYRSVAARAPEKLVYYGERPRVSAARADRELGLAQPVTRQRAMELTLGWARYARLLEPRRR